LSPEAIALLDPLEDAIESVPGFSLDGTIAALTCCDGSTCSGEAVALPASLELLADIIGGLPYQSCIEE
jgi:hypothetical protein